MRRLMRPAGLLLLVAVVALPALADKAKDLYHLKGQDAEARQNYEAAFDFFQAMLRPQTEGFALSGCL